MRRLFEGGLRAIKNCIDYSIIIFRVKPTESMSFDFDYFRSAYSGAVLIRVNTVTIIDFKVSWKVTGEIAFFQTSSRLFLFNWLRLGVGSQGQYPRLKTGEKRKPSSYFYRPHYKSHSRRPAGKTGVHAVGGIIVQRQKKHKLHKPNFRRKYERLVLK